MISTDTSRGPLQGAAISASVPDLVIQLRTELHGLVARNKEIGRRIHNIRRVMRGLQEIAGTPSFSTLYSPASGTASSASTGERISRRGSNHRTVSLLRACRIALMEAPDAATLEDIYARIVRRGSFSFVNRHRARSSLLVVLNVMTRDGEVRLLDPGPACRWERIPVVPLETSPLIPGAPPDLEAGMQYSAHQRQPANQLG